MSNVVPFPADRIEKAQREGLHLGPGVVASVAPDSVEVRLSSGANVRARMALAFPYEAVIDDVLLVIGIDQGYYVIGVLSGQGTSKLAFHGDVEVRAMGGSLRLSADKDISMRAPEATIQAGKLRMVATAVHQTFATVKQRVTEMLSLHAAESHTVVDGPAHEQAKSKTMLTEDKMTINGKSIYLG